MKPLTEKAIEFGKALYQHEVILRAEADCYSSILHASLLKRLTALTESDLTAIHKANCRRATATPN